jgi:uncharacterized membrane protein
MLPPMEDLLAGLDFDPIVSPVGLVVVLIGVRMLMSVVKTAIRLVVIGLILVGAYFFFYGGNVT